jgi:hypothetical protein
MAGVQRHFLAKTGLQGTPNKFRDQDLVFEQADLEANLLVEDALESAGDLGNHGSIQPTGQYCW